MRWRAFGKPTPYTHIYTRYAAGLTGLGGGGDEAGEDAEGRRNALP
jgi:hypothetical protein